jgi:hypothetical protein
MKDAKTTKKNEPSLPGFKRICLDFVVFVFVVECGSFDFWIKKEPPEWAAP